MVMPRFTSTSLATLHAFLVSLIPRSLSAVLLLSHPLALWRPPLRSLLCQLLTSQITHCLSTRSTLIRTPSLCSVNVSYDQREFVVSWPSVNLLASVLDAACVHFHLEPLDHRLELMMPRGANRPLDLTLSLRLAGLAPHARLALTAAPGRCRSVQLILELPTTGASAERPKLTAAFPVTTTLQSVLSAFQQQHPQLRLESYTGTPQPEVTERYSLHIVRPGRMQAVVDSSGYRVSSDEELSRVTLASLGLRGGESGRPGSGRLHLSHDYRADAVSEETQAAVMEKFGRVLSQSVEEVERGVREKAQQAEKVRRQREQEEQSVSLPPDRRLRVFRAAVGLLPSPELPDEFYEVTEQDSLEYARGIQQQAAAERGGTARAAASGTPRRRLLLSVLRIKLPLHCYVEGVFRASETVQEVRRWLSAMLRDGLGEWELVVTPPRRVLQADRTLREEGLLGAVMLHWQRKGGGEGGGVRRGRESLRVEELKSDEDEKEEMKGEEEKQSPAEERKAAAETALPAEQVLKDEVLAMAVDLPPPAIAQVQRTGSGEQQPAAGPGGAAGISGSVGEPVLSS